MELSVKNNHISVGLTPPLLNINTLRAEGRGYINNISHSHPFYHVNYITEGSMTVIFENHEYAVTAGQAFILPPDIPHGIYTDCYYSQIGMDIKNQPDEKSLFNLIKSVSAERCRITDRLNISTDFNEMNRLLSTPTIANALMAENLATNILLRVLKSLNKSNKSDFAKMFENILSKSDYFKLTLTDLCELTGYSRVHLERMAQAEFGCGAIEYINRLKTNKICQLIIETDLSLTEIADKTGFYDVSHLSVFFKKRMGITPGKYKKSVSS